MRGGGALCAIRTALRWSRDRAAAAAKIVTDRAAANAGQGIEERLRESERRCERLEIHASQLQRRLDLMMQVSRASMWEYVLEDGSVSRSRLAAEAPLWANGFDGGSATSFEEILDFVGMEHEERVRLVRAIQACVDGETPDFQCEYHLRHADGAIRWRLARGTVSRDGQGKPTSFTGVGMDITELKRAEHAIRDVKERLERAVRGSQVSVWDFVLADDAMGASRLDDGYNVWESRGHDEKIPATDFRSSLELVVASEDRERVVAAIEACVRGKVAEFQVEYRAIGYDDDETHTHWRLARGNVVRGPNGTPARLVGTSLDVTPLRRAEEQERRANEQLKLATRLSKVYIWVFEIPDGQIGRARATFTNVWESLGYDPPLEPMDFEAAMRFVILPEDQRRVAEGVQACLSGASPEFEAEYRIRHSDGSIHWNLGRGIVARDAEGVPLRFLGTSVDITELKRIEDDLRCAREAAESANRAKDAFLANVSHEIRTPMNAILGLTELALDDARTEHQRELLTTVRSAARNLLGIINDLLDFSKMEAGKLALEPAEFSLRVTLEETLRPLAHSAEVELTWQVRPDVPDALLGDAGRLRQVLMNVVGNAIKFTPRGVVDVDVANDALAASGAISVRFTVRDTGIGIAPDKQSLIFRAFEQEDASTTRKYGGTGLGLTIAAQLVALMGGGITVESTLGRGSTFAFTARFARASRPETLAETRALWAVGDAVAPELVAEPRSLRILVAEDNDWNVALLEELFRLRGHRAEFVGDGRAAVARAANGQFDVMLLDLHLPAMDGFQVVAAIRDMERATKARLPVIAVTARSSPRDRERCLAAGMDGFLSKPIEPDALWSTVDGILAQLPTPRTRSSRFLDPNAVHRMCGGRPAVLARLREAFLRSLAEQLTRIRAAMEGRDLPRLSEAAHVLLGTVTAFSPVTGDVASTLDDLAAKGEVDGCLELVRQLESMCAELLEEARTFTLDGLEP